MSDVNAIKELFLENNEFILLGLTGRTGSGCSTAAKILSSETPNFPSLESLGSFYSEMDGIRYNVLKQYTEEHWKAFNLIKVSDLISAYILLLSKDMLAEFIYQYSGKTNESRVEKYKILSKLDKAIFKEDRKSRLLKTLTKFIDHSKDFTLATEDFSKTSSLLNFLKGVTTTIKNELDSIQQGLYISTYQAAGNSIRRLGKIEVNYEDKPFEPISVFHLPETLNKFIKGIKKENKGKAYVVIDALRNPYEVKFFKDRYSAFHLVSINAPDENRRDYLNSYKFSGESIDEIDERESGKVFNQTNIRNDKISYFTSINISRCIEVSDIHIYNPKKHDDDSDILRAQLAWYVSLMLHPGLVSPTSMERVMQLAYSAKLNSGCISRQVGAVVTDINNSIKSVGWNDVAKGQISCALRTVRGVLTNHDNDTYSDYELNNESFRKQMEIIRVKLDERQESLKGMTVPYCFKDIKNNLDSKGNQVHTRSLHAEENAFLQLSKYGSVGIEGGRLYTTASPCELCAKKAYQLGIKEIIYIDPYPGIAQEHILNIGKEKPTLTQFRGAIGRTYHRLYEQVLPLKDEYDYLIN
ncbi:deoxycytidylate deaminase [Klebsiella variicola]|uniref:anti-phage dCTP deaminase n=1 Tax=Klebsiella variicola TaxID=244366 RepID=UPI001E5D3F59|nr:anti-phage dCTP deaminase [Klebsiella variicola]MCC5457265.1 deoxycytidylate deaminase [Klebsiella variicola]